MINTVENVIGAGWLNSGGAVGWTNYVQLTANTTQSKQFVRLTKQPEMQENGEDVRFVKNISGSGFELIFLPYEYLTSDGSYHYFVVSHNSYFSQASSTFYAIYGNASAVSESNPYVTALEGHWKTNYFTRGAKYDVANTFRAWDTLIDGDGSAGQEANWPDVAQLPVHQIAWGKPQSSDYNHVFLAYKYDPIDNIHAGSPTSKAAIKVSHDFGESFSSRSYIHDPDEGYYTTSSSSNSIPTSGADQRTFTVAAGLNYQVNDVIRVFNSGTTYWWGTVVSYSGTSLTVSRLSNTGTGTYSSWHISQRFGATNTQITTVKLPSGTVRLIAHYTLYDFYNLIIRTYRKYTDLDENYDITTWSSALMVSDDTWANVGGGSCTDPWGGIWWCYHENAVDTADYSSTVVRSIDYGVTVDQRIRTVAAGSDLLDETDLQPMMDANGEWDNVLLAVCRNEYAAGGYHQMKYYIDFTPNVSSTASSRDIAENDWGDADGTVSRYRGKRCPDMKTVIYAGGDQKGKMIFTRDEFQSFHPIPVLVLTTSAVSARRTYSVLATHVDGRCLHVWASNRQPNGSDLYINYWDWTFNNLYTDTINTLTDGSGTHNRPRDVGGGGIRIGEFLLGYRTSSSSSVAMPTLAGQQRTFTVATGLSYAGGEVVSIVYTANNGVRWTGTVISYNSGTGELVVECLTFTGSGTQSTWQINLGNADNNGNLLANQAFLSIPIGESNGQIKPWEMIWNVASVGTGLVTGGFWGAKRFETRGQVVITISDAGSAGDTIRLDWRVATTLTNVLFGVLKNLASYTVESGDTIADVVAGLVADANRKGICPVVASDATTLTLKAPHGYNTLVNTRSLTVVTTGTVAGSSGNFASGTAIEASTALQHIQTFDNPNNVWRCEQNNDNHNQAFTVNDGPVDYINRLKSSESWGSDGTTTRTKGPATGSGVPNTDMHGIVFLTTSPSSPQGVLNVYEFVRQPHPDNQTIPTEGSPASGNFVERIDGRGIQAA